MFNIEFGGKLIQDFFLQLEQAKINYIVLRNYEGLPETNSSKDVDILIDEVNINLAKDILKDIYKELHYNLIWKNELDYLTGYAFAKKVNEKIYSVKIDIFHGLKWRGVNYINNSIVFNRKKEYNNLYIPNKSHESFIMILYYILYAQHIKSKYFKNILLYKNDIESFNDISIKTFDSPLTKDIMQSLSDENILNILTYRTKMIRKIIKNNFNNFPSLIKNILNHIYCELFKRNSFGVIILFDKNFHEKEFLDSMFLDLGIGYELIDGKSFNLYSIFKILRKNPLITLTNHKLSFFQKQVFKKRIININSMNLDTIFLKIQEHILKGNN